MRVEELNQVDALDRALKATMDEHRKVVLQSDGKGLRLIAEDGRLGELAGGGERPIMQEVPESATNGTFVVLDDEVYLKHARENGTTVDIEYYPGGIGFELSMENGLFEYEYREKRYFIKRSLFERLTEAEKAVFAMHGKTRLDICRGSIPGFRIPQGMYDEQWINEQPGCDIRPIMGRIGLEEAVKLGADGRFTVEQFATRVVTDPDRAQELLEWLSSRREGVEKVVDAEGNEPMYHVVSP